MPAHIDLPSAAAAIDPVCFLVNGWVWLGERHAEIATVEAWADETLLGADPALYVREDIVAAFSLPAGTATGFNFAAHRKGVAPGTSFELHVRARFRDGTRTPSLASLRLSAGASDATNPFNQLHARLPPKARGLEIGAHTLPTAGLTPFLTDAVPSYVGTDCRLDFLADACVLPVPDDTLDYLCSSHVMEHLPNPVAALFEWHRVLRPGGLLYLVVPDKRFTFDAPRAVTPIRHLLGDFAHATTATANPAHVDEFIYQTDWDRLQPGTPAGEKAASQAAQHARLLEAIKTGAPVDIHFHTFTPDSLFALLTAAGLIGGRSARFDLRARAERFPMDRCDGIGFLLEKRLRPTAPPEASPTHMLMHPSWAAASLPVVCPLTLTPLHLESNTDARPVLVNSTGKHRYPFHGSVPNLLPLAGSRPVRPWSSSVWRGLWRVAAALRAGFASASL